LTDPAGTPEHTATRMRELAAQLVVLRQRLRLGGGSDRVEKQHAQGKLAARPPSVVALTKALLYELGELGFEEGLERAAHVNVEARMTEACREGVRRFLERQRAR